MASAHRIYAEALFSAAKDAGRLAQVHEALADFAAAAAETPELGSLLRNPIKLRPDGLSIGVGVKLADIPVPLLG